ncbi:diaminopimelate epimerase [Ketogulonicigenium vulgare]|uniref:Diaminopimelate epimerase n=1 Tax=Ketogulonicigenium vulgare (strain WSH-001) TaxID=759362 RepID=F9Y853_KETVW|nr:diaminopimelate epimerase [Ketogulonicigenium vulgare]AEM42339.1 Diaminopimelate epimerase [Ketogulonicigenium vulgare WSH-001]ALJ79964.1 diaminopimelate epimerase [Ketogulonicigenium vulgare]ANW32857.1 diaminopimelate epimerase [Ketogulonicigenium vulgare]
MTRMQSNSDTGLPFMKMHGLGNDFVVMDERGLPPRVTPALVAALADRNRGVGFDQMAIITDGGNADLHLTFFNADGSPSAACGNATRCIARYEMDRTGKTSLTITTDRGVLLAREEGNGLTSVNMGHPMTDWDEIPLAEDVDTLALPILGAPTATSMGNPHCTFFVDDVMAIDLAAIGPTIEHHPLFPERTNVQFAQVIGEDRIRMRVWERGTGITLASGSSSCATAVAAYRRGLTRAKVEIVLDGGSLQVEWRDDGVWMTGPTMHAFNGVLTQQFLDSL